MLNLHWPHMLLSFYGFDGSLCTVQIRTVPTQTGAMLPGLAVKCYWQLPIVTLPKNGYGKNSFTITWLYPMIFVGAVKNAKTVFQTPGP